jgi:hypothetical protein
MGYAKIVPGQTKANANNPNLAPLGPAIDPHASGLSEVLKIEEFTG